MDIAVRLVELTAMHPRLLWADIIAATVAVCSAAHQRAPFPLALAVQDLPGFGSAELRFTIDPVEVAPEHVSRLQRTYESSRLVELAAIAIAGLGLYYGGGHEVRVRRSMQVSPKAKAVRPVCWVLPKKRTHGRAQKTSITPKTAVRFEKYPLCRGGGMCGSVWLSAVPY